MLNNYWQLTALTQIIEGEQQTLNKATVTKDGGEELSRAGIISLAKHVKGCINAMENINTASLVSCWYGSLRIEVERMSSFDLFGTYGAN